MNDFLWFDWTEKITDVGQRLELYEGRVPQTDHIALAAGPARREIPYDVFLSTERAVVTKANESNAAGERGKSAGRRLPPSDSGGSHRTEGGLGRLHDDGKTRCAQRQLPVSPGHKRPVVASPPEAVRTGTFARGGKSTHPLLVTLEVYIARLLNVLYTQPIVSIMCLWY